MHSIVRQSISVRMSTVLAMACLFCGAFGVAQTASSASASAPASSWKQVEDAMGSSGQMQPGDVIKFGMPRKDLHIVLDGVDIKPGLALGSWAAFKRDPSGAMVMGDLVLTEDEVEPVMMKLQGGGIHESAVHNHLMGESPHVMYVHIASQGDAVQMAKAIHDALALTGLLVQIPLRQPNQPPKLVLTKSGSNRSSATLESSTAEPFRSECRGPKQLPIRV